MLPTYPYHYNDNNDHSSPYYNYHRARPHHGPYYYPAPGTDDHSVFGKLLLLLNGRPCV